MARHTRSGVQGMSMCRTPRWETASMTARRSLYGNVTWHFH